MAGLSDLVVNDTYEHRIGQARNPMRGTRVENLRTRLWNYLSQIDQLAPGDPQRDSLSRNANYVATQLGQEGVDVRLPSWYQSELGRHDVKPGTTPNVTAQQVMEANPEDHGPPVQNPPYNYDTPGLARPGGAEAQLQAQPADPLEQTLMEQAMAMLNNPNSGSQPSVPRVVLPEAEQTPLPEFAAVPEFKPAERLSLPEAEKETPPGRHSRPFNMALVETGLRLAASKRANFLGALAEAGLEGMQRYSSEEDKLHNRAKEGRAETRANETLQLQNQQMGIARDSNVLARSNIETTRATTRNATERSNTEARNATVLEQGRLEQQRGMEEARLRASAQDLASKNLNAAANVMNGVANYRNARTTMDKENRPKLEIHGDSGNIVVHKNGEILGLHKLPGSLSQIDKTYLTGLFDLYEKALDNVDTEPDTVKKIESDIQAYLVRKEKEEQADRAGLSLRY